MTDEQRLGIGGNNPPSLAQQIAEEENFSAAVTAFLESEYPDLPKTIAELLDEARQLPKEIADEAAKGKVTSLIKRLRDSAGKARALHVNAKEPYLRGGQAVDQFFFALIDKCARRNKADRPGAADILQDRLTAYDTRVLEAERARRAKEAEEAARRAREAQEKAIAEAKAAEEARLAAERARKPETVEAKGAIANQREAQAVDAQTEATLALAQAEQAHVDTLARPADIMRHRGEDGTLSTMATEPYAIVEDYDALDIAKLRPFIGAEALDKALRAWAKTTNYNQPMAGARIGRKPKSVVR